MLTPNKRIIRKKTMRMAGYLPSLLHSAASANVAITTREHVRALHSLLAVETLPHVVLTLILYYCGVTFQQRGQTDSG